MDTSITKDILEAAANDIENSQSDDFEIAADGSLKVNDSDEFDIEDKKSSRKVEEPKPKKSLTQTTSKAKAEPPAELQPPSDKGEAAATPDASGSTGKDEKKKADDAEKSEEKKDGETGKNETKKADEKKDGDKAKSSGKSAVPSGKGKANHFVNWWDDNGGDPDAKQEDSEPDEIKDHPEYKKLVNRFLGGLFKDAGLERASKVHAIDTVEADEIKSTKEREGFYPNELDQEMKGYTYGDRLPV